MKMKKSILDIESKMVDELNNLNKISVNNLRISSQTNALNTFDTMIFSMSQFSIIMDKEYEYLYQKSKACRNDID